MTKPDDQNRECNKSIEEQINLLFDSLRNGEIDVHKFMKLLGMAYGDFLDFHPEQHPYYNDKLKIDRIGKDE